MKSLLLSVSLACCTLAVPSALAQDHHGGGGMHEKDETKAVNTMCPVAEEPIVASEGTFEYKGNQIGVCCQGCAKKFNAWDEAKKDNFVALAIAHSEPGTEAHDGMDMKKMGEPGSVLNKGKTWTGPYTLNTCPVSGQKLGAMGDPVVKMYNGREVRFCCGGCIEKFESDQAGYWKKIDAKIIKDQLRYYPPTTCIVSGEPLVEDGEDIAKNMVYGNRLVRLCCNMCKREFKADPAKFIATLDKAVIAAQSKDYPIDTCIVSGDELGGSMGESQDMVVAGRMIRLCCADCKKKVKANPAKYVEMVDAAWQKSGKYMPAVSVESKD